MRRPIKWVLAKNDNKAKLATLFCTLSTLLLLLPLKVEARIEPHPLDPLVVSASLTPEPLSGTHASVSLISRQDIEDSGFFFVGDIIRAFPGISVASTGPPGSVHSAFMRGHDSKHTLVMLNGAPLNATGSHYDFAHLVLNEIERIEIIRGPQSVVHGAGAIGGVINLITRTGKDERDFSLEAGSFASTNGHIQISTGSANRFSASAGFYRTDNIDITAAGEPEKDGYENHRASLSFQHQGRFGDVSLNGRYQVSRFYLDGFGVDGDPDDFNHSREWLGHAIWSLPDMGALSQRFQVSSTRKHLHHPGGFTTKFESSGRRTDYLLGWQQGSASVSTLLGHDWQSIETSGYSEEYFFAATEGKWHGSPAFNFDATALLRAEFGGEQDDAFVWRASIGRTIGLWRAYTSYGTAINNPTVGERYTAIYGNPNLKREISNGFETGITWQNKSGHRVNLVWFDEKLEDKITFHPVTYVNVNDLGKSSRRGAELSTLWPLTGNLRAALDFSLIRSRNSAGKEELRRPKQQMRAHLLWNPAPWQLSLTFNGIGAREEFGGVRLKSYYTLSFNAAWRVDESMTLFVRGENILNEAYETAAGYRTRGAGVFAGLRASY